jgi:acetyl esterase
MHIHPLTYFLVRQLRKRAPQGAAASTAGPVSVTEERLHTPQGEARVLIYQKKDRDPDQPAPLFINLHGGGFILMNAEVDDPYCRLIAAGAGCVVVNLDYKLAPEHPFPAAFEETYAVTQYFFDHAGERRLDPKRIAIGGHSAGGNLAAAVCLKARETGAFTLCAQILDYPPLDLATEPGKKVRYPKGSKIIPPWLARIFNACYVLPKDARNPLVSPLYTPDLSGLPPALVIAAEQDSLAEEDERYAQRLAEAGVPTTWKTFTGVGHGFTHTPSAKADEAWGLMIAYLRKAFQL